MNLQTRKFILGILLWIMAEFTLSKISKDEALWQGIFHFVAAMADFGIGGYLIVKSLMK